MSKNFRVLIVLLVLVSGCGSPEKLSAPRSLNLPTIPEPPRTPNITPVAYAPQPAPVAIQPAPVAVQQVPVAVQPASVAIQPAPVQPVAVASAPVQSIPVAPATVAFQPVPVAPVVTPVAPAPVAVITPAPVEASSAREQNTGLIKIDGSSTVYPISKMVAEEYTKLHPELKIEVLLSGTGGGFKKFVVGGTDVSDASRPITQKELEQITLSNIGFIEIPVAFDGLSIVVNPKNQTVNSLTIAELRNMWKPDSTVKSWKDVRPTFPDEPIVFTGASTDNGTYDYFTEEVVGEVRKSRHDYFASHDPEVTVKRIEDNAGAIGYFGFAYYMEHKSQLKVLGIDNGSGKGAIFPQPDTILNGTYAPLSRPLFIYVSVEALKRPEVESFIRFYMANAAEVSKKVGYIALPEKAYDLFRNRFNHRQTGSIFGGNAGKGVKMEDVLK